MSGKQFNVAIAGATGAVGDVFLSILAGLRTSLTW